VSGKPYDIGLPMDLQEALGRLADEVGANVPEVAHALIRDGFMGIAQAETASGREHSVEAIDWWKRCQAKPVRTTK
jgi:hypothetical protein